MTIIQKYKKAIIQKYRKWPLFKDIENDHCSKI